MVPHSFASRWNRCTLRFCAVLFSFLLTTATAHADAVDSFVLSSLDHSSVSTFSLLASPPGNLSTCPTGIITSCLPGSETAFYLSAPVTTNGVTTMQSLAFPTDRFGGGLSIGSGRYFGLQLFLPDAAYPTFRLGSFALMSLTGDHYTLTIAPQATDPVPEPSSLLLLGTGTLSVLSIAARRIRTRSKA